MAEQARGLADGTVDIEDAYLAQLFPDALLDVTDTTLEGFEAELRTLVPPTDEAVMDTVRRVVLALNAINTQFGGGAYETAERELLCDYIDRTLTERGIDVPALAARQGLGRYEITDEWRDW